VWVLIGIAALSAAAAAIVLIRRRNHGKMNA